MLRGSHKEKQQDGSHSAHSDQKLALLSLLLLPSWGWVHLGFPTLFLRVSLPPLLPARSPRGDSHLPDLLWPRASSLAHL